MENRLLNPQLLKAQAYHVQDASGMLKLDAMESPYSIPESIKATWLEKISSASLNRYPDPQCEDIRTQIIKDHNLAEDYDVMFGNGSDEIIQILIQAIAQDAGPIMSVNPSFVMYDLVSTLNQRDYVSVDLDQQFCLDEKKWFAQIQEKKPALIFIAYPNNPSGNLFPRALIEKTIEKAPGLVVIDEAYALYSHDSFLEDVAKHPNLLVLRTVSKMGLAGLRFGLLFGHKRWINQFNKLRLPYNINCLTQVSMAYFWQQRALFSEQAKEIISEREKVSQQLSQLSGVTVYPSQANFILLRLENTLKSATDVFNALKEKGILIKNMDKPKGHSLHQCLRVTISNPQENNVLLSAMKQILESN